MTIHVRLIEMFFVVLAEASPESFNPKPCNVLIGVCFDQILFRMTLTFFVILLRQWLPSTICCLPRSQHDLSNTAQGDSGCKTGRSCGSLVFSLQKLVPPYKWPYKWVAGVITLLMGIITPCITGMGPSCATLLQKKNVDVLEGLSWFHINVDEMSRSDSFPQVTPPVLPLCFQFSSHIAAMKLAVSPVISLKEDNDKIWVKFSTTRISYDRSGQTRTTKLRQLSIWICAFF